MCVCVCVCVAVGKLLSLVGASGKVMFVNEVAVRKCWRASCG